jgi:hypothetical protein
MKRREIQRTTADRTAARSVARTVAHSIACRPEEVVRIGAQLEVSVLGHHRRRIAVRLIAPSAMPLRCDGLAEVPAARMTGSRMLYAFAAWSGQCLHVGDIRIRIALHLSARRIEAELGEEILIDIDAPPDMTVVLQRPAAPEFPFA